MSAEHPLGAGQAMLEMLTAALRPNPAPSGPSALELEALNKIVAEHYASRTAKTPSASRPRGSPPVVMTRANRRCRHFLRPLAGAIGAMTMLAGATAAAACTEAVNLPRPVRQAAYDLGLPGVESPQVTDLRELMGRLNRARLDHDGAAERQLSAEFADLYRRLDPAEQHDVGHDPALLGPAVAAGGDTASAGTADSTTTPDQPSPVPALTETSSVPPAAEDPPAATDPSSNASTTAAPPSTDPAPADSSSTLAPPSTDPAPADSSSTLTPPSTDPAPADPTSSTVSTVQQAPSDPTTTDQTASPPAN